MVLELLPSPEKEGADDWPSLGQVLALVQSLVAGLGSPPHQPLQNSMVSHPPHYGLVAGQAAPKSSLTFGENLKRLQDQLGQGAFVKK